MSYFTVKLKDLSLIKTGKLDSNEAVSGGTYPFFTCDPNTLRINNWAYDTEAVLLAGNNASGNYTAKYYNGKFNAYQRVYIIETADRSRLNTRYLCYAMNQQLQLLKTMSSGSTTKFLTLGMLHGLDIPLPAIADQDKIVSVLSVYDDLIENNQKQIKLLEEAAQRLYKEWFIDLRFPGHETTPIVDGIPQGWENASVTDLLEIRYGKDHKGLADGCIPVYGSGGIMRKVDKILYSGESVLIPRKGSLNNILLVSGDFWTIDTMFYSVPKRPNVAKYVYLYLTGIDMYAMNIGAAVPSMTVKILDGMRLLCPSDSILELFETTAKPYYEMIELLKKKQSMLGETRDRLLPKLMSGEIEA